MTRPVPHSALVEYVARRILSEMDDHGGADEFCEKLLAFPEQYCTELALAAIDCVGLCGCLRKRVEYGK